MVDIANLRLWDLFVNWSQQRGAETTIKNYIAWFEENYQDD